MCGLTAERNSLYCAKLVLDRSYKSIFKKTIIFLPYLFCLFQSLSFKDFLTVMLLVCKMVGRATTANHHLDGLPVSRADDVCRVPVTAAALHRLTEEKRSPRQMGGGGAYGGGGYKIRILQSTKIKLTNKQTYVHTLQRNITRTYIRTRK